MSNLKKFKEQLNSNKNETKKIRKAVNKANALLRENDITKEEKLELERTRDGLSSRMADLKFDLLSIEYFMLCTVYSSYIPKKKIRDVHGINGDNYINIRRNEIIVEAAENYSSQLSTVSTDIRQFDDDDYDRSFRAPDVHDELISADAFGKKEVVGAFDIHARLICNAEQRFSVSKRPTRNEAKLII